MRFVKYLLGIGLMGMGLLFFVLGFVSKELIVVGIGFLCMIIGGYLFMRGLSG